MDNKGIRKRKDAKENKVNLQEGGNSFINDYEKNNNNWNCNSFTGGQNANYNVNRNKHEALPNMGLGARRNSSSDSSKSRKKKSINIFNGPNISAISNNCMKSFNNMLSNINSNLNSSLSNNSHTNHTSHNGHKTDVPSHTNNRSGFSTGNSFCENQFKNLKLSKGLSYISNITNIQEKFSSDNRSATGKNDFNFFRNYENNLSAKKENNKGSGYNYSNKQQEKSCNNEIGKMTSSSNRQAINSQNLESLLNNKEIQNPNYNITGFGNNYMNEINNLRNITNDETYCTCLDNLLRNHGNIDSNEMLKYNDKNINCLNDIIFLDVYRAYNVLTYMQEKINIIIYTIKIIGKKLKKKHVPEEVVISLEFLNFCAKNLGLFFVRFLDESFMKKISALLKTTTLKKSITKDVKSKLSKFLIVPIIHPGVATDPRLHFIKRKILFMLQLWHDSFILHQHIATAVFNEYKSLKEKGITFPIINKAEKFYVKNADKSPVFSDDNILHALPLKLPQINNIIKILKEIKHMSNDEEKSKCITIVSKYKDLVFQSINELSDYNGNVNISVTLNSLLYINDQICIFEKWEKERKNEIANENLGNAIAVEKNNKKESTKQEKKKKSKKKENSNRPNINEIIFNKYDPWNTEKKTDINEMESQTFFNERVQSFTNATSTEYIKEQTNDLFDNQNMAAYNNENMFSFFSDEQMKKEVRTIPKNIDPMEDKYSVFNELNFNYDDSGSNHIDNHSQPYIDIGTGTHNDNVSSQMMQQLMKESLPLHSVESHEHNKISKQILPNNTFNHDKGRNNLLVEEAAKNYHPKLNPKLDLDLQSYNSSLHKNERETTPSIPVNMCISPHTHTSSLNEHKKEHLQMDMIDDCFNFTQFEYSNRPNLNEKNKNQNNISRKDILSNNANTISDYIPNDSMLNTNRININFDNGNTLDKGTKTFNMSSYNSPFNEISFGNIIETVGTSQISFKQNESKNLKINNISKDEPCTGHSANEANYDYLLETFDLQNVNNNIVEPRLKQNVEANPDEKEENYKYLKNTSANEPTDLETYTINEQGKKNKVFTASFEKIYEQTSDIVPDEHTQVFENMKKHDDTESCSIVNENDPVNASNTKLKKHFSRNVNHQNQVNKVNIMNDESNNQNKESSVEQSYDIANQNNVPILQENENLYNDNHKENFNQGKKEESKLHLENESKLQQEKNRDDHMKDSYSAVMSEGKPNEKNGNSYGNIHADSNGINLNKIDNIGKIDDSDEIDDLDEIDEITKAIDNLNDNFENMNIYKYNN
ncbi:hypothetical protein, conserved [Plasmodium gonderi]|uniref:VHS domain-containing protein n=1 Tax=Plasmodium gonderi TaxID=77519 RepID=A0A1Y1JPA9_PLAGO|nr:hypothetical protein, conserved [Plasmodium gonderi]GAW83285.1 hypothetical protein, conserved [Plasmodium gonderi]